MSTAPSAPDFRALVEHAADVFTVVDGQGRILYDSPAVERVLGFAQGELVGRNALAQVHRHDLPAAFHLLVATAARPGAAATLVLRFRHRDGGWRWLECAGRTIEDPTGPARVVIASREVGERVGREAAQKRVREEMQTRLRRRDERIEALQLEMLERLARAAECRDDDTGQHTRRVGELARRTSPPSVGRPAAEVERIRRTAPLHDVGKIGIRDALLLKPGPLLRRGARA